MFTIIVITATKCHRHLTSLHLSPTHTSSVLIVALLQSLSCAQLSATPWAAACQASLSFSISWNLLKLMSIESVMPSSHLILCCPFLFLPQSFPALGSFPISWLFTADDPNIGASAVVLPMNIQEFPLGLTYLIPLLSEGLSTVFSKTIVQNHQFSALSLHVHVPIFTSVCDYWENHTFD